MMSVVTNWGDPMATFVLVHGAWHGSWCWKRVRKSLQAEGHDVFTPTLTGVGERSHLISPQVNLETHIADVVNLIRWEELDDVVLCGHSYGGAVISEAGAHHSVRHLVYLCAFVLDVGESVLANAAPQLDTVLNTVMVPSGDVVSVTPEGARAAFYADVADPPLDRLVPHDMRAFTTQVTAAAWRDKPSTYVLCAQDQAIHPDRQRFFAGRCGGVVELEASHSPMLSMPDRVAEILRGAAT